MNKLFLATFPLVKVLLPRLCSFSSLYPFVVEGSCFVRDLSIARVWTLDGSAGGLGFANGTLGSEGAQLFAGLLEVFWGWGCFVPAVILETILDSER